MIVKETYEATYPHYPFAPLVRAALAVAARFKARDTGARAVHGAGDIVDRPIGSAA